MGPTRKRKAKEHAKPTGRPKARRVIDGGIAAALPAAAAAAVLSVASLVAYQGATQ